MALTVNAVEGGLAFCQSIDAPRDLLWKYVSSAGGLAAWQADAVTGDLESRNFSLKWPELGARLDLSVAEVEMGERIVLRSGATALELKVSDGQVELTHRGLDPDDDLEGFESSWKTALALLRLATTKHPGQTRTVRWLFEKVETPAELLHHYLTAAPALGTWLGKSDGPLVTAEHYEIQLFGGGTMSGDVLHAERDVCLHVGEWNNGALSMRSLPGPDNARIAALGISTFKGEAPSNVRPALKGALNRLAATTKSQEG